VVFYQQANHRLSSQTGYEEIKDDKNITEKRKMNMENKLKILQIMKDYEEEEKKRT
jgi:hypothetical protein